MLQVEHVDVAPDGFLAHDPEDARYHRAFQAAGLPDFRFGYLIVRRSGVQLAVLPYFVMNFQVNTMLPDGWLKRSLNWLRFNIACVGHPSTDLGHLDGEPTADVLAAANRVLQTKARLVAYKGFGPDMPLPGFVRVPGMPVAVLQVRPDYWTALPAKRRHNLKTRLKNAQGLRLEEQEGMPAELVDRVYALYLKTYERAAVKFELLNPQYFVATGPVSRYLFFYHQDELVGFMQLICKHPRMVVRYIGMDYVHSERHGLYFAMFLRAIDVCLREGFTEMESGATSYAYKRLFGSELAQTWVYYRHTNPVLNWVLGKIGFLLEPSEDELK